METIKDIFVILIEGFRLADLFDIIIIFLMLYNAFLWFKKASSRFVLIGLGFLGIVYLLSKFFNLYLTSNVLDMFFTVFILAIVVIFQEDIRKFFERVAFLGLFHAREKKKFSGIFIEVLTDTVTILARKRIGALIVVKGKDPLERHLRGCISLNGEISEQLIESIFDSNSPGHDGAMVIEKGVIKQFGCHLPLSTNFHKVAKGGTRHMAALGLAEKTDALCIVVSEERGVTSVAHEGAINPLGSAKQLSTILRRFYKTDQLNSSLKKKKFLSIHLTHNMREKAIALIMTCILWAFVGYFHLGTRTKQIHLVPIKYTNLPENIIVKEPKPEKARVTLEGLEKFFFLLDPKKLLINVDMKNAEPGEQEIFIEKFMVERPEKLSVRSIEPNKFTVNLIKVIHKQVPVIISNIGTLPGNLSLIKATVTPSTIQVVVSESMKKKPVKIMTEPVDFEQIKKSTTLERGIIIPKGVYLLDKQPESVRIDLKVEEKTEENSLKLL
jgi:diadenylate cyclase